MAQVGTSLERMDSSENITQPASASMRLCFILLLTRLLGCRRVARCAVAFMLLPLHRSLLQRLVDRRVPVC